MKSGTMFRLVIRTVVRIFNHIRRRLYVNETLILFEHERFIPQESPADIARITHENVADVLDFQDQEYLRKFREYLSRGDAGYFAYLDGKCVHRAWVVHTPKTVYVHPMLPMQLKDGEAFIHFCETAPLARGRNIYPAVLSKIAEDFRKKSYSLMISANAKNSRSIRGILKSGFREKERERIMVLLGIKLVKSFTRH